jgi:hypothetical protein
MKWMVKFCAGLAVIAFALLLAADCFAEFGFSACPREDLEHSAAQNSDLTEKESLCSLTQPGTVDALLFGIGIIDDSV